eukprot:gene7188-7402_t
MEANMELLVMPPWLKQLALGVASNILARPETFRDVWDSAVDVLLQQADQAAATTRG